MPRIDAFHSAKERRHHDNSLCGAAGAIPPNERISGTGGKPLCKDCGKLHQEEAASRPFPVVVVH